MKYDGAVVLEGTVSLLEIEKAWINLLLIKRGKIMEI